MRRLRNADNRTPVYSGARQTNLLQRMLVKKKNSKIRNINQKPSPAFSGAKVKKRIKPSLTRKTPVNGGFSLEL